MQRCIYIAPLLDKHSEYFEWQKVLWHFSNKGHVQAATPTHTLLWSSDLQRTNQSKALLLYANAQSLETQQQVLCVWGGGYGGWANQRLGRGDGENYYYNCKWIIMSMELGSAVCSPPPVD